MTKKIIISCGFSELILVKNIAGIIRAVPKNTELWVIGNGPEKDNLEQLSKSLKVKVRFFGRVENKKAREIMRKSDIFVSNSFHEGMSHALIEALAEGVPIVATKIPAALEVLTDKVTGLLVDINDPYDLAKKISEIKNYPKLSENGRKLYRDRFTWKSHLKVLRDIFDSIS